MTVPFRSATCRRLGPAALVLAALASAGCATAPVGEIDRSAFNRVLHARGLDPDAVPLPYELNDEMRTWVHRTVPRAHDMDPIERLQAILDALLDPRRLKLEYESHYTATAEQVFESRRANCLSFTNLFVGLAREIGVPVFFLDVDDVERYEKEGDLVVVSGHVSAGFGAGPNLKVLDFAAAPRTGHRVVRAIPDLTAIALYYSNRGGELLRLGKHEEALPWLRIAVALDPELSRAWVNLGVALRRANDLDGAEDAYRTALEADPGSVSAYQNLSLLLRLRGHTAEADQLMALSEKVVTRNPFNYLNLGDLSLSHGRLEQARRFYRRALRLHRQSAEPYAAMGLWAVAAGDEDEARKWLRKASAKDPGKDADRLRLLEARLAGMSAKKDVR
jgi:tetratricopeptide (TPR) repeat protein